MIQEPLDVKRTIQVLRRHKIILSGAAVLGLLAGAAWVVLQPSILTSQAGVALAASTRGGVGTQVVFAGSEPVLMDATRHIRPAIALEALRADIEIKSITPTLIVISAKSRNAAQAEQMANAVANSYVHYVGHPGNVPGGPVEARAWQSATPAAGTKASSRLVGMGLLGASLGAVIAALCVLATSRRDRRLRERDAIADSIGLPVVASINVDHPADAAGWRKLLTEYEPGAVDGWRLRKTLQYLGMADMDVNRHHIGGLSLTVISSSSDRGALALGPQLAAFAASRGVATALVVCPQQDIAATATLRTACVGSPSERSDKLRTFVRDHTDPADEPGAVLTVVVAVVDTQAPDLTGVRSTTATVLGVSAGAATAEELARITASAAVAGHDVIGILVADPDPTDTTTGRVPQVERPVQRRGPTRLTGTAMEAGD